MDTSCNRMDGYSSITNITVSNTIANDDNIRPIAISFIPLDVLTDYILPCLSDRSTWNAISLTRKEINAAMTTTSGNNKNNKNHNKAFPWPWPKRIRLPKSTGRSKRITAIAFSPCTKTSTSMMACGSTSRIDIFDVQKGHCCVLHHHLQGTVRSIAFSPPTTQDNGTDSVSCKYMAACTSESNPRLWKRMFLDERIRSGAERRGTEIKLLSAGERTKHVLFSPNGEYLLCVSQSNNDVWSYHIATETFHKTFTMGGGSQWFSSIVGLHGHLHTGSMLVATSSTVLRLVQVTQQTGGQGMDDTPSETNNYSVGETIHSDRILNHSADRIYDFSLSNCGKYAVAGGVHGFVQIWKNIRMGTDQTRWNNNEDMVVEYDGAASQTKHVLYNETIPLRGLTSHAISVAFSPDGQWVAAVGMTGTINVWHVPTASPNHACPRASLSMSTASNETSASNFVRSTGINNVCFTPDSLTLVATGNDGCVHFWGRQFWTKSQ